MAATLRLVRGGFGIELRRTPSRSEAFEVAAGEVAHFQCHGTRP